MLAWLHFSCPPAQKIRRYWLRIQSRCAGNSESTIYTCENNREVQERNKASFHEA